MSVVNLSGVEDLIPPVAQMLGIEPATALLGTGAVIVVARIGSRLIPDNRRGFLGIARKVLSFIAIDIGNRVAPGITVTDVAKAVITRRVTDVADAIPSEAKAVLRSQLPELDSE